MDAGRNDEMSAVLCKSGRDKHRKLRFASMVVACILVFIGLFTIAMTILYCVTGGVPEALCTGVYGMSSAELLSLAAKRIFDKKKEKDDEGV